jgi:Polycystin cation channel
VFVLFVRFRAQFSLGKLSGNVSAPAGSPLLGGLYWEQWYNGRNMSEENFGYVFYENRLMGSVRIRQVRVRNDSCTINHYFKDQIAGCYASFSSSSESKDSFGPNNGTA